MKSLSAAVWKRFVQPHGFVLILTVAVFLIGYQGIFSGKASFLDEEDPATIFEHAHGNAIGNGWRPDKGLGISFFYGDPGMTHAWSVFSLLEKIFPAPTAVYNFSIIALLILALWAQYFFLNKIRPHSNRTINALLSTVIVFGPLQYELYFQRHWITFSIGTPLFLWLLYRHLEQPRTLNYFWGGGLLWFVLFFGSAAPFAQILAVGFVFLILYCLQNKSSWKKAISRYGILHFWAMVTVAGLGAWIFYPIFLETRLEQYVRDPIYFTGWGKLLDLPDLFYYLFGFFHCGLWCAQSPFPRQLEPLILSWMSPSLIFPLIMVFVFAVRTEGFWPKTIKYLYLIFLAHDFLRNISSLYESLIYRVSIGYPFLKFHCAIHCLAIALIAFHFDRTNLPAAIKNRAFAKIARLIPLTMACFYALGLAMVALIYFQPQIFLRIGNLVLAKTSYNVHDQEIWSYLIGFTIDQLRRTISWETFIFWFLSLSLCVAVFYWNDIVRKFRWGKQGIAALIVVQAIFLSWVIYPLRTQPLLWEHPALQSFVQEAKPTDRFYSFGFFSSDGLKSLATVKQYWPVDKQGRIINREGYCATPGLNLSGVKSFGQKSVQEYFRHFFKSDDLAMRDLVYGPRVVSPGLDMAAVKYFYSRGPFPGGSETGLRPKLEQPLFIYENSRAWPYAYLAKRLEAAPPLNEIRELRDGSGYVAPAEIFSITAQPRSFVNLTKFSFGEMEFDYFGQAENFLVVADAWHPFWRARIDGVLSPVVKANFIFKGLRLPAGKHSIRMYFDTSAYTPGIYLSIAAWLIWLSLLAVFYNRDKSKKVLSRQGA